MSWQDAHRYRAAVRSAAADLNRTDGALIWRAEYAGVFGSPHRLRLALGTYWRTMVQAQVEIDYELDGTPSVQILQLAAAHPGLARALGVAAATGTVPTGADGPEPAIATGSRVWQDSPLVGAA